MTVSVHLLGELEDFALEHLRSKLTPTIELRAAREGEPPGHTEILVAGRPSRDLLRTLPSLWALIIPFAGLPPETRALMLEFPGIAVHNLHHNAGPTAEMAIALMLAAAKFLVPLDRALRSGDWRPRYQPNPSVLLEGRRALILGYGAIGKRIAALCQAFGMQVQAVRRRSAASEPGAVPVHPVAALWDLLPHTQVLHVCAPLTEQTEGLLDQAAFNRMPDGAILVNVARGPIVDEGALYDALQSGKLLAAGIDVWYQYPDGEAERANTPPSELPFAKLDNVVMSPHRASHSRENDILRMDALADLLNRAARNEELPNRVDLAQGY